MSDTKEIVSSQPQDVAQMKVGGNKNALSREVGADGKREWSFGLFDCFSACGLCCWATWCPCVVYSKNRQRLRNLQYQGAPLQGGGERYTDACCIHGLLTFTGYGWVLQINNRNEIRDRYGIRGDAFGDCLTSWLCRSCALTQERRELELEERSLE
ncbi:PLAC8 family-domain-containing protein [Lactifluus subvellereus]|nr:PLAC8 family-domain-containing protein [Lactifluus subvellereus]